MRPGDASTKGYRKVRPNGPKPLISPEYSLLYGVSEAAAFWPGVGSWADAAAAPEMAIFGKA
jgi:hypothetical protein